MLKKPTKAVALAYSKYLPAPKVVASGRDKLASLLIQKALELDIPVFQNVALANALINIEVDDFIPEASYLAVAKVLVWLNKNEQNAQLSGAESR